MTEHAPNNADYLQQYPLAVEDIDKAHVLAHVGNELETKSAELRSQAIADLGQTAYRGGYQTRESADAENAAEEIRSNNITVDTIYSQHAAAYEKLRATKR